MHWYARVGQNEPVETSDEVQPVAAHAHDTHARSGSSAQSHETHDDLE
jgi:hypothetical protein